jgi:DNA-binding Lrp family transcriptional regulator|tara:strand:- start:77 stop:1033 length:957 start_codon:yes stop_codon:yes gene_type:complete
MSQINEETSNIVKVDKKDNKIIELLKEDSRITYQQISKKVELSHDSVAYRIKRLEKLGVIDRYSLDVNYSLLGFDKYHILFQLLETNQKEKESFYNFLIKNKNVTNIILYSDKWDIKVEILAKSTIDFDFILTEINNKFSKLLIDYEIMQEVKDYGGVIKSKKQVLPKLDETDKIILNLLGENSRISYVDISKKTNLSADAIIYRMNKFQKSDLIKKYVTTFNVNTLGDHWYEVVFLMKLFTKKEEEKLINLIKRDIGVIKIRKTIGNWNILFTILAKNPKEFQEISGKIRTLFKENIKDYDTLLAYKELKNKIFFGF